MVLFSGTTMFGIYILAFIGFILIYQSTSTFW